MTSQTPVSVVMTRGVRTLDVTAKLSQVRRALLAHDFHHMPIVDGNRLVGMISWRDLLRVFRAAQAAHRDDPPAIDDILDQAATVEETMSTNLVTVRDDDSLDRAIDLIADGDIHSVLVLNVDDRLVGIVTDENIVEYLAS